MNVDNKELLGLVIAEGKKLKFVHWLFVLFISVPLFLLSSPFYFCGIIGALITDFHFWLVKKLPDYDTEDVSPISINRGL